MGMLLRRHHLIPTENNDTQQTEITSKSAEIIADVENTEEKTFTKTEINRMSKDDLTALAKEQGIKADDVSGSKLKEMLIDKLGL